MKQQSWCLAIATLGPIGYLPAPGTMATIATIPIALLARSSLPEIGYIIFILFTMIFGLYVINHALSFFTNISDPAVIVFDELIGCLVTFIAIPLSWSTVLAGFVLFRFFDITKIGGIHYSERLPGATGVIVDDVLAAVASNLTLHLFLYYHLYITP